MDGKQLHCGSLLPAPSLLASIFVHAAIPVTVTFGGCCPPLIGECDRGAVGGAFHEGW